jgi:hypothetical protein
MHSLLNRFWIASLFLLATTAAGRADFVTDTLGSAGPGNYALLSLTGATDIALNGPGTTTGNVGISSPGRLALDSSNGNPPVAIKGDVYLGNTASITHPNQVQGTVFTNQDPRLNQANVDARNAANTFAALAPTLSVPGNAINGTTTINGTAGVNVLDINSLHLGNGQALTLNGPAGAQFVVNDSGNFTLNSGRINLAGGLTPSDVVFNVTGRGPDVQTSGGLNNESVINGVLLATGRNIGLSPGLINGELIAGGQSIHLVSGASVNGSGAPMVPAPPSVVLMGLGGVAFVALVTRSRRRLAATV